MKLTHMRAIIALVLMLVLTGCGGTDTVCANGKCCYEDTSGYEE